MALTTLPMGSIAMELSANKPIPAVLCNNCGSYCPVASGLDLGSADERRITELEAQINLLRKRAAEAEEQLAEYQPNVRHLNSNSRTNTLTSSPGRDLPGTPTPAPPQSRFGSLLGGRKLSSSSTPGSSGGREVDLAAQLAKEQEMRQRAEGTVQKMSVEMEDLSATLFQQANEMVATERRARAKLEERVEVLEKRDSEKRERLERLEKALRRIERVKGILRDNS